jgi:hypothetical protein
MSKKSTQRHAIKTQYFDTLKETAVAVDPYVKNYIESQFSALSEIKDILLTRYRF